MNEGRLKGGLGRTAASASVSAFFHFPPRAPRSRGFTLLEMVIVLVIIALLAAAMIPAFDSAMKEHALRDDSHALAMMVRTAMVQSAEQHRPYAVELTKNSVTLHPLGKTAATGTDSDASLFRDSGSAAADASPASAGVALTDVEDSHDFTDPNKLQIPDPGKTDGWMDPPDAGLQWVFQPGELCPATRIRVARNDAYLEMTFAALTGDVDSEKSYFP